MEILTRWTLSVTKGRPSYGLDATLVEREVRVVPLEQFTQFMIDRLAPPVGLGEVTFEFSWTRCDQTPLSNGMRLVCMLRRMRVTDPFDALLWEDAHGWTVALDEFVSVPNDERLLRLVAEFLNETPAAYDGPSDDSGLYAVGSTNLEDIVLVLRSRAIQLRDIAARDERAAGELRDGMTRTRSRSPR